MKNRSLLLLAGLSVFLLSGCVTQETADQKMAKGCAAGVNSLIAPREIAEVKSSTFGTEQVEGSPHRRVVLKTIEKSGWLDMDREYSCFFLEQWGFAGTTHRALIVQLNVDGRVYGKKDGKIIGDLEDFMKFSDVVENAMGQ